MLRPSPKTLPNTCNGIQYLIWINHPSPPMSSTSYFVRPVAVKPTACHQMLTPLHSTGVNFTIGESDELIDETPRAAWSNPNTSCNFERNSGLEELCYHSEYSFIKFYLLDSSQLRYKSRL